MLTSSSESLEVDGSGNSSATNDDGGGGAAEEEETFPAMRASSFAILVGRDWSDWLDEFDEKCNSISSDMVRFPHKQK